jgi:hypothetical protein
LIATLLLPSIQWAAKPENAEVQLSDSERIVGDPEVSFPELVPPEEPAIREQSQNQSFTLAVKTQFHG